MSMDTNRKMAGMYLLHRLIDAAEEYEKRTGASPTHIEATEDEIAAMASCVDVFYSPWVGNLKVYGITVVPIKRRIGREAEPVIDWEDA
jgi:hypothetical protein